MEFIISDIHYRTLKFQTYSDVKDFPKSEIPFKDITPALADSQCFALIADAFYNRFKEERIDKIAVKRVFLLS